MTRENIREGIGYGRGSTFEHVSRTTMRTGSFVEGDGEEKFEYLLMSTKEVRRAG